MPIILNGDPVEVAAPLTLSALLAPVGVAPRRVAVHHTRNVIKRADYDSTRFRTTINRIVNFVGGRSRW